MREQEEKQRNRSGASFPQQRNIVPQPHVQSNQPSVLSNPTTHSSVFPTSYPTTNPINTPISQHPQHPPPLTQQSALPPSYTPQYPATVPSQNIGTASFNQQNPPNMAHSTLSHHSPQSTAQPNHQNPQSMMPATHQNPTSVLNPSSNHLSRQSSADSASQARMLGQNAAWVDPVEMERRQEARRRALENQVGAG